MKRSIVLIMITVISSLGSMTFLYLFSNKTQTGDFYRSYPPHSILFSAHINLSRQHNYITGNTSSNIFLSSTDTPDKLLRINQSLNDSSMIEIDFSRFEPLRFYSLSVKIDSPYFYVSDGSMPFLFRGHIRHWAVIDSLPSPANFKELVPMGHSSFVLRSVNVQRHENELGKIIATNHQILYNNSLLQKQVDGIFCTDGMLHYSTDLRQLIYLYYYRNEYIVADSNLHLIGRGQTIDTTFHAAIKATVLQYEGHQSSRMATPPLAVNKRSCVYQRWLFVLSNVEAKNESRNVHENSSVIDVYDITQLKYMFSFYLQDLGGEKVKHFIVTQGQLFALYGRSVESHKLNPAYFERSVSDENISSR